MKCLLPNFVLIGLVLLASTGWLSAQAAAPQSGTVTAAAPVYLRPDPNREPLATVRSGTVVKIIELEGDWYRVEFKDQYGTRTGYIRAENVSPTIATKTGGAADPTSNSASGPPVLPAPPTTESMSGSSLAVAAPPARDNSGERPSLDSLMHSIGASSSDVERAVSIGMKQRGRNQGLVLVDSEQQFTAAMGSLGGGATPRNGFSVEVFTPLAWIQQLASDAAKEYRTFSPHDLTDEAFEPVIRVVVHPDTPNTVTAAGMRGTSSVRHVVMRDERKRIVIQPISREAFTTEAANAMGGRATFEGIRVKFALGDFRELRGPDGDAEFLVTVIGTTGKERDFRVKRKHFSRLP